MQNLAKRKTTFLQDIPLISICFIITSKCEILQKGKRLFCKIFHLLVYVSLLILVNALCCKIFHIPYFSSLFLTRTIGIETTRVLFWKYSAVRVSSVQEQHQNRLYQILFIVSTYLRPGVQPVLMKFSTNHVVNRNSFRSPSINL